MNGGMSPLRAWLRREKARERVELLKAATWTGFNVASMTLMTHRMLRQIEAQQRLRTHHGDPPVMPHYGEGVTRWFG